MEEKNLIQKVCKELGLTTKELSEELEVSPQALSQWKTRGIPKDKNKIMELMLKLHEKDIHIQNLKNFQWTMQELNKS